LFNVLLGIDPELVRIEVLEISILPCPRWQRKVLKLAAESSKVFEFLWLQFRKLLLNG
jgi:hypothetical protein